MWRSGDGCADGLPSTSGGPGHGASEDRYTLASFAMLPWSNRISGGGFEHDGHFRADGAQPGRRALPHPRRRLAAALERWRSPQPTAWPRCSSNRAATAATPTHYDALQRFELVDDGLQQSVRVTHLGETPLPYGLGLHPWFPRTPARRCTAPRAAACG